MQLSGSTYVGKVTLKCNKLCKGTRKICCNIIFTCSLIFRPKALYLFLCAFHRHSESTQVGSEGGWCHGGFRERLTYKWARRKEKRWLFRQIGSVFRGSSTCRWNLSHLGLLKFSLCSGELCLPWDALNFLSPSFPGELQVISLVFFPSYFALLSSSRFLIQLFVFLPLYCSYIYVSAFKYLMVTS